MDAGALSDEARLRQVVAAAEPYLTVAAPELTPVSFAFEEDHEHACLRLVASTRANGGPHKNVIDRELCQSPEFEEARRLAEIESEREEHRTQSAGALLDLADKFERTIGDIVGGVAAASSQLQATASSMASAAAARLSKEIEGIEVLGLVDHVTTNGMR